MSPNIGSHRARWSLNSLPPHGRSASSAAHHPGIPDAVDAAPAPPRSPACARTVSGILLVGGAQRRGDQVVGAGPITRHEDVPNDRKPQQALTSGSCGCGSSGSQRKTSSSISPPSIQAPICWPPPNGPPIRHLTRSPSVPKTTRPGVAEAIVTAKKNTVVGCPLQHVLLLNVVRDQRDRPPAAPGRVNTQHSPLR